MRRMRLGWRSWRDCGGRLRWRRRIWCLNLTWTLRGLNSQKTLTLPSPGVPGEGSETAFSHSFRGSLQFHHHAAALDEVHSGFGGRLSRLFVVDSALEPQALGVCGDGVAGDL